MNKLSLMFKGFVLVGLVILTGIISINAQTVSTVSTVSTFAPSISPYDVAFDSTGNMYVSAKVEHKIYKVTPAGVASVFAGTGVDGYLDGPGNKAKFNYPYDITVDPKGNVYVIDGWMLIRMITPDGVVSTFKDFRNSGLQFTGILSDPSGNFFYMFGRTLYKANFDRPDLDMWVAGGGNFYEVMDGVGQAGQFADPKGLARDSSGNLYTTDTGCVRKIITNSQTSLNGPTYQVITVGPKGTIKLPQDVAVDSAGNIFVSSGNGGEIWKLTQAGVYSKIAGDWGKKNLSTDGPVASALFNGAYGLAFSGGAVYVAEFYGNKVRKIK